MKKFVFGFAVALLMGAFSSASASIMWVAGSAPNRIYNIDPGTGSVNFSFTGPGVFSDAVQQVGTSLFILDSNNNSTVFETDLAGNVLNSFFVGLDAEGLGSLNNGNLVIGGGTSNVVRTIDQSGNTLSQFAVSTGLFGIDTNGVDRIFGLTINGFIQTFDLSGNLLGSMNTGLGNSTLGLAYTGSSFFVSNVVTGRITEFDLLGNQINSYAAPGGFSEGLDFVSSNGAIPEPGTIAIWSVLGLAGVVVRRRNIA